MILLRTVRWSPVFVLLGAAAVFLALADEPHEAVGAFVLVIPAAVAWLVDDPAATVTAGARYGRHVQLAARCATAAALAAVVWVVAVAWSGGSPSYAWLVLVALLAVALAAGITWGATYGGPAAALALGAAQLPRGDWAITGARWWVVVAIAACWLAVAARDPVRY